MEEKKEAAPQVNGITEGDFQVWRHHPVSKLFLSFLSDKRKFLERAALDQWVGGVLSLQADQTLRGQIIELMELVDLPFDAIVMFYQEEDNAAKDVTSA